MGRHGKTISGRSIFSIPQKVINSLTAINLCFMQTRVIQCVFPTMKSSSYYSFSKRREKPGFTGKIFLICFLHCIWRISTLSQPADITGFYNRPKHLINTWVLTASFLALIAWGSADATNKNKTTCSLPESSHTSPFLPPVNSQQWFEARALQSTQDRTHHGAGKAGHSCMFLLGSSPSIKLNTIFTPSMLLIIH